jgi:hypothetical protein
MAQFASRFHDSRNDRTASGLANEYIIWKPWSKNACASAFVVEIFLVKVPSPVLNRSIGAVYRCSKVGDEVGDDCCCARGTGADWAPRLGSVQRMATAITAVRMRRRYTAVRDAADRRSI